MIREWLCASLRGEYPGWTFPDDIAHESIADEANAEGVIVLLHDRLNTIASTDDMPVEFKQQIAELAREKTRQSLMREAECRRILADLHKIGIEPLLLKGSALAYWAYASPALRECSDIDLLFSSHTEAQAAIRLLQERQYFLREPVPAGDLVSFEHTCVRPSDSGKGLEIDLHWKLSSSPLFAFQFHFDELKAGAILLAQLGPNARGLSPVHAFFNACMHRVQNMAEGSENRLKWLYDLHLLASRFNEADWKILVDTAIKRGLAGVCHDAMKACRVDFKTAVPAHVLESLAFAERTERIRISKMHGWLHIQKMSFLAFPTTALRLRWLKQRLFPDIRYLQARHGAGSFFGLMAKRADAGLRRLFRLEPKNRISR